MVTEDEVIRVLNAIAKAGLVVCSNVPSAADKRILELQKSS